VVDRVIITKYKFPKIVWQHYVGDVGKSINVMLQIVSVNCVPNFYRNRSNFVESTAKLKNMDTFMEQSVFWLKYSDRIELLFCLFEHEIRTVVRT